MFADGGVTSATATTSVIFFIPRMRGVRPTALVVPRTRGDALPFGLYCATSTRRVTAKLEFCPDECNVQCGGGMDPNPPSAPVRLDLTKNSGPGAPTSTSY